MDEKIKNSHDADAFVRSAPTTDGTISPSEGSSSTSIIPQVSKLTIIDDKGTTWFKTGFPGKAESIENIIKTKIAEHSARILSHNAQGPSSQNKTAISLLSIQKELSNVNEKYKQAGHDNQAYRQGQLRAAYNFHTGAIHLFDAAD